MGWFTPFLGYHAVVPAALRPLDVLLTLTQQRVLALLFAREEERSLGEIVRRSGGGSGAIQRELARMAAAGLLQERRVGNQRRFRAARASPYYRTLKSLAAGPAEPAMRATRRPSAALLAGREAALRTLARFGLARPRVFGSVARGEDTEASDLDLLVDAGPRTSLLDLSRARNALEDALGVTVDLVTEDDLPARVRETALAEAVPL
jgi:predicted nucleotidyltransferase